MDNLKERSKSQVKKTKFHIVVRIRPPEVGEEFESEIYTRDDLRKVVAKISDKEIRISKPLLEDKIFEFDKVLKHTVNQEEAFNHIAKNLLVDVTEGYNGTIMAYGQTGSGKTYTIFGKNDSLDYNGETGLHEDSGIVPRSVCFLFDKLRNESENSKIKFKLSVSFFQIYLEQITDLIPDFEENDNKEKEKEKKRNSPMNFKINTNSNLIKQAKKDAGEGLRIREDPKLGVFIQNLKQIQVEDEEQLLGLIKYATKNRITHNTNMNTTSSRSHAILRILFEKRTYNNEKNYNQQNYTTTKGLLTIVDLAGSEKSKLTNSGIRKEESKYINSSIYHLGSVVYNLANNLAHVNFRETSLTRVLKECLCGNSKNSICATVSPFLMNYEETLTTLQFASQAKFIRVNTTVNIQYEIKNMKDQLYNMVNNSQKGNLLMNSNLINSSKVNNIMNMNIMGLNNYNSHYNNHRSNSTNKNMKKSVFGTGKFSNPNSTREIQNNSIYNPSNPNIMFLNNQNESNFNVNNNESNESEYQILNKKYFQVISYLQKELCQKELEMHSLLKDNKNLKVKLSECQNMNNNLNSNLQKAQAQLQKLKK